MQPQAAPQSAMQPPIANKGEKELIVMVAMSVMKLLLNFGKSMRQ